MGEENKLKNISVNRISLDLANPRHTTYQAEKDAISYLCANENIYELAKDIAKNGLNPFDNFALIPKNDNNKKLSYYVAEGNRRICAIKLLSKPQLAPNTYKKRFESLAKQTQRKISNIRAIIFPDRDSVKLWLARTHEGLNGGIGRKSWSAEQKARHSKSTQNKLAQTILDYAEHQNFITADERKNKLTTAQRYLSNPVFKDNLGIDASNLDNILRNRPKQDFDLLMKIFINDLKSGTVNSRAKAPEIIEYSRTYNHIERISGERIDPPVPIFSDDKHSSDNRENTDTRSSTNNGTNTGNSNTNNANPEDSNQAGEYSNSNDSNTGTTGGDNLNSNPSNNNPGPNKPPKPKNPTTLLFNNDLGNKLQKIDKHGKLYHLYSSICRIKLDDHICLITLGAWALTESLTALDGRNDSTPFTNYLNGQLIGLGILKNDKKAISYALERIANAGNTTKHHAKASYFDAMQLYNDINILSDTFIAICTRILQKSND